MLTLSASLNQAQLDDNPLPSVRLILTANLPQLKLSMPHQQWLEKQYPQQINRERLCQEELPKALADLRVVLCYALQPLSREVLGQQLRVELALLLIKAGQQLAEQERKVRPGAKKDSSHNPVLEPDWKLVAVEYLAEVARLLRLIEDEEAPTDEFLLLLGNLVEAGVCLATAKDQPVSEARRQFYHRLDCLAVKLLLGRSSGLSKGYNVILGE